MGGLCESNKANYQYKNTTHPNTQNNINRNQPISNHQKSLFIDPIIKKKGARYLIRQVRADLYNGNVPGGKMPIKLIFSLDKTILNQNLNPSALKFNVSISTIENPKVFKLIDVLDQLDTKDFIFSQQIITDYFFEIDQQIKVQSFYNGSSVAEYLISSAKINGSLNHTEEIPICLSQNSNQIDFKLIIISDPIAEEMSRVAVSFEIQPNFSNQEEYFAIFLNNFNNKIQKVYKTEEAYGPNPKLFAKDIAIGDLTFNGSKDQEFVIEFYSHSRGKVGSVNFNLNKTDGENNDILDDSNMVIGKSNFKTSKRTIKRFIDFIYGGLQISLICAIDFTGSNGYPNESDSLHYINSSLPNQYQQALMASAGIIAHYDSDKKFPVYGFGAEIDNVTEHCFNCNLKKDPEVNGVEGIMEAYKYAVKNVALSGPTLFEPILQQTIESIKSKGLSSNTYHIMLILTDGLIEDFEKTRKRIIEASSLAISIIIVGVGDADFSKMNLLDGDEQPLLDDKGRKIRDIVQFVKYEKKYNQNLSLFSQDLLFEIPNQVEAYYS